MQEEEKARDTEDSEIDHCCKQFVDLMQAHLNRRYDLRSSKKRTCTQEQEEEPHQKEAPAQQESTMQKGTNKGYNPQ